MKSKSTTLVAAPSAEKLAMLKSNVPTEPTHTRVLLPRIVFKSQDVTEETKDPKTGKKKVDVITEAGTFLRQSQRKDEGTGELVLDEDSGKPIWDTEELGTNMEGIIAYQRKQLRYFDESTDQATSSPIYDEETDVIPLFCDRAEVGRGTPAELRAQYPGGKTLKGKDKSLLEDQRVLYVLLDGVLHQLTLRGSSMYSYMDYSRKVRPSLPAVLTHFSSTAESNGNVSWNKMSFEAKRPLTDSEVDLVLEQQGELKDAIAQEKAFYASQQPAERNSLEDEFKPRARA